MGSWPSEAALQPELMAFCPFFTGCNRTVEGYPTRRDAKGSPFSRAVLRVLLGLVGAGYQRRTMSVVPLDPTEIHRLRDRYLRLTFDKAGRLVASENGTKTGC